MKFGDFKVTNSDVQTLENAIYDEFKGNNSAQIQSTIYRIEQRSRTLESIDDIYESLCQIYYTEMDVKLK